MLEVEKLRREPYDCENPDHEEMLMKVSIHNAFLKKNITKTANLKRNGNYIHVFKTPKNPQLNLQHKKLHSAFFLIYW